MEPSTTPDASRKLAKKRQATPAADEADPPVESDFKRRKIIEAHEPSRKQQLKQQKENQTTSSELEKHAVDLTLEKLTEYLNSTEEDAITHGMKVFCRRMVLDVKKSAPTTMLEQYFASSPHFNEIFSIWEFLQHKDRAKTFPGAQLLEMVDHILRLSGPDSPAASVLSRELLKRRLQALIANLSSEFNLLLISTLKVLKSIVSQGPWQAREVFRNFNFASKQIARLMDRRQPQSSNSNTQKRHLAFESDVRTHFVRLGLAILRSEDDALVEEALNMKNFLGNYFKGFALDATPLILEVIETLREACLRNPAVSKRAKSLFFTASILDTLCSKLHDLMVHSDAAEPSEPLSKALYAFLHDLLASGQTGILYKEATTYQPPSNQNQAPATHNPRVLVAMQFLKPADHPVLARLCLAILMTCPPLKRLYADKLKLGLDPRPTLKWHSNIRFVQRVIVEVPLEVEYYVSYLLNHSSDAWGGSDRVVSWIVPSTLTRQILVSAASHADKIVSYAGLMTCCDILETCERLLTRLSDNLKPDLLHSFRKRLPDLQTILAILRKVEQTSDAQAQSEVSNAQLLTTLYRVLRHFVKLFPEAFVEARFDFGKLMTSNQSFSTTADPMVAAALLQLLQEAAGSLRWNASLSAGATQLSALLNLMLSTPTAEIYKQTRVLVETLLIQSGLFDGANPVELAVWLDALTQSAQPSEAMAAFERILNRSAQEPYAFAEAISRLNDAQSEKFLPVSIPLIAALQHRGQLLLAPADQNLLHRVLVGCMELSSGSMQIISRVLELSSPYELIYSPLSPAEEPRNSLGEILADANDITLASKFYSHLFDLKQVQTGLDAPEIVNLLQSLPLHLLIAMALKHVHQSHHSKAYKFDEKLWHRTTTFVARFISSPERPVDYVRALATLQFHLATLIEYAERSGSSPSDVALKGIKFCFESLFAVCQALLGSNSAAAIIGTVETNEQLRKVFLAPSQMALQISRFAVEFFEKISPEMQSKAFGWTPFSETAIETIIYQRGSAEIVSLARRAATALLPLAPAEVSQVLYLNLLSNVSNNNGWVWQFLISTMANGESHKSSFPISHLAVVLPETVASLKFIPSRAICERLFGRLMQSDDVEPIALATLAASLAAVSNASRPDSASNAFDCVPESLLLHLINNRIAESHQASAIVALALLVQPYCYGLEQTITEALVSRLEALKSSKGALTDAILPTLAAFLKATRHAAKASEARRQIRAILQCEPLLDWILAALDRCGVVVAVLLQELFDTSSKERKMAAERVATQLKLWPIVPKRTTKVSLSSASLQLLSALIFGSDEQSKKLNSDDLSKKQKKKEKQRQLEFMNEKLAALVLREIYSQGILGALKSNDETQYSSWRAFLSRNTSWFSLLSASDVTSVVKSLLKERLNDARAISTVRELLLAQKDEAELLRNLHDLLVSHPVFLDVLYGSSTDLIGDARAELVELMLAIYKNCGRDEIFAPKLLRVYLGAYSASLSRFDRALLRIVYLFEERSISLARAGGMMWGPHARKLMLSRAMAASQSDQTPEEDLEEQVSTAQALFFDGKLIEAARVSATLRRFPVLRKLDSRDESNDFVDVDSYYDVPNADRTPLEQVYDPAFLLPFFNLALRSFELQDCKKFIDVGALSFTLMCLSSEDVALRQEAYRALSMFDSLLGPLQLGETAFSEFREQPQVRQLLNCAKNSILSPASRLTSILAAFLSQAAFIVVRPDHPMYININEFLASRALLDIDTVPMFRQLFFSTSLVDFKRDREWLLRILSFGLIQPQDLDQLQRRRALALLQLHLAASDSVCSERESGYIWTICQNAIMIDRQHEYTLNEAALTWAAQLVISSGSAAVPGRSSALKQCLNVASILQALCRVEDIAELANSAIIWSQLTSLLVVVLSRLEMAPLPSEVSDLEERDLNSKARYEVLRWSVALLHKFTGKLHTLDVSLLMNLLRLLDSCEVTNADLRSQLRDIITMGDLGAAVSCPVQDLSKLFSGLLRLSVESLRDSDVSSLVSPLKWLLSIAFRLDSSSGISWTEVASSWKNVVALVDSSRQNQEQLTYLHLLIIALDQSAHGMERNMQLVSASKLRDLGNENWNHYITEYWASKMSSFAPAHDAMDVDTVPAEAPVSPNPESEKKSKFNHSQTPQRELSKKSKKHKRSSLPN